MIGRASCAEATMPPGSSGPGRRRARSARGAASADPPVNSLLEVRLDVASRGHPLAQLLESEGASTRLVACRLTDQAPRRLMRWLDVEVDPARTDRLLATLRGRHRFRQLAVARLGPGRVLIHLEEPAPPICAETQEAGGICVSCPLLASSDRESWRVILPRGSRARSFVNGLPREIGARRAIARVEPARSRTSLTPRQDLALRTAFSLGYFDYPRRGTLAEVARQIGSGRSATLEMLRRATAKLADRRYGEGLRGRVAPELHRRAPRTGH